MSVTNHTIFLSFFKISTKAMIPARTDITKIAIIIWSLIPSHHLF